MVDRDPDRRAAFYAFCRQLGHMLNCLVRRYFNSISQPQPFSGLARKIRGRSLARGAGGQ